MVAPAWGRSTVQICTASVIHPIPTPAKELQRTVCGVLMLEIPPDRTGATGPVRATSCISSACQFIPNPKGDRMVSNVALLDKINAIMASQNARAIHALEGEVNLVYEYVSARGELRGIDPDSQLSRQ